MREYALEVRNLSHHYGSKKVLHDINLKIRPGEVIGVIGPSGCGKSTLLHSILGTVRPTSGTVVTEGIHVTGPSRHVGIVYQHYSLYPFMTARENVAVGLKWDQTTIPSRLSNYFKWKKLRKQHLAEADEFLKKVGLEKAGDCYPTELSGGMRQRVAIAQSLIMRPSILLLDEPFGALDEATRESLQILLLNLYQENLIAQQGGQKPPHTVLIVTHELNEALYVSNRVVGLTQYHAAGEHGATIMYDQPSPVFHPNDPKDFRRFEAQKAEIRECVFSPDAKRRSAKLVRVWEQMENLPRKEEV